MAGSNPSRRLLTPSWERIDETQSQFDSQKNFRRVAERAGLECENLRVAQTRPQFSLRTARDTAPCFTIT
jgi:hypothetical protein